MRKINVMIIDDSAFVRQTLTDLLNSDPEIHVTSTAADPIFAAKKITKEPPDVITLDLEMPRMNGLTFLKKLMSTYPVPVVVISSLTEKGSEMAMKSLEYGAVDVITKPRFISKRSFEDSKISICDAIKAASLVNIKKLSNSRTKPEIIPRLSADEILKINQDAITIRNTTDKIVALGASTGGTTAILSFLERMPADCPGIVIVQHMPELFTKSFADRLDKTCTIKVKEGTHGDLITRGKAIIAPGNKHMLVAKTGAKYFISIQDGPLVNRHRPSVDVLFRSAANCAGPNSLGIIMTGMGDDGARGLLEMKQAGAYTIAQDEESCVVFGMPKAAISMNAVCDILPLHKMADLVYTRFAL